MTETLERASTAAPRPELDWERDWQGRPRILADPTWTPETAPPGWVQDGVLLAEREYTRVTTHAEALQDSSALTRWKLRRAVIGMSRRLDYVTAAAALTTEDRDREALDDLAEKALEAAGPNAADVGTALHGFTERIDRGEDVGVVPPEYQGTLDAYRQAVTHLTFLEFECRTVCDELEAAGTPDRVGMCDIPDPDGETECLRIIDTKTGRVDYSAGKFSTQLATYRRSKLYHPGTGARTSWKDAHGLEVSHWGLVVHIPAGADTAELLWIDLAHGDRGALTARLVREWRKGATSARLLQPVFARAPRPATTDGTCRGRKQDEQPCGYRRKSKADGLGAQFCGRHQEQATDLQRWLAENPDLDPDAGVEQAPSMRPVQPSSPAVQLGTASTEQVQQFLEQQEALTADAPLAVPWPLPNGRQAATPGTVAVTNDGIRWVKVQRDDAYGWEREERVTEAGGPQLVRCAGTNLLVTQCACSVHRPDLPRVTEEEQEYASALAEAGELGPEWPDRDLEPARDLPVYVIQQGPVGTYALDPAAEVNGTPRPVSGLHTPDAAQAAMAAAWDALHRQITAAGSETELQLVYAAAAATPGLWMGAHTEHAGRRSAELAAQRARERPHAALLAAVQTAPDQATITRLFTQYASDHGLWDADVKAAAANRWTQLAAMAQL